MPKFRIEKDGQVFEVEVAEGEDPNAALAEVLGEAPETERTLGEEVTRQLQGARRGSRIFGAPLKLAAGVSDIGAGILNLIPAGLSEAQEFIGGKPITARLPTDATETVDQLLDRIFGAPQNLTEEIALGAGELAVGGVAGGAALTPRAVQLARSATPAGARTVLQNLGDEIGQFFLKSPKTAIATEAGGAIGATGAGELAEAAELGPLGTFFAELVGGVAGGVTPQGAINISRRASTGAANFGTRAGAERRAAQRLQEVSEDPAAAARAAEEAPTGVLPGRATDDPGLKSLEARVLEDDPILAGRTTQELKVVEAENLATLADDFGPGTTPQQWQQRVVQEVAPEGTTIAQNQPDEMLSEAFRSFGRAYDDVRGHTVKVNVPVTGEGVPLMPRGLIDAVRDPAILTGPEIRQRVGRWLHGRYTAIVRNSRRTGEGPADNPVFEVTSGQLLELRHVIRKQRRAKFKAGQGNADAAAEAELLANADRGLTETIERALPTEAATALRQTDAKYAGFITVEEAANRGTQGLTSDALRGAIKARTTTGQFARGETGRLGELSEQGANINRILRANDVEAAERMVRTMNPAELSDAKANFVNTLQERATATVQGEPRLVGQKLLNEVDGNRQVLTAAGFNADELGRIERVGRTLKLVQNKSATAVTELIADDVGTVMRLLAAIAGSRAGTRILKMFGGSTGAGPSLILAQFGSRTMRERLGALTKDKADQLLRAALSGAKTEDGQSVLAALLTKPTDAIDKQANAARTIQAWLIAAGAEAADVTTTDEDE